MFILGKLSLADIKCQQYCSRIPDECGFAASIYKDKMFRTILGTGINLAQSALSLQLHPSEPAISNFSDVNKDKEKENLKLEEQSRSVDAESSCLITKQ